MNDFKEILEKNNINANELESLLEARESKDIEFVLIDVRESYESESARIPNTNYFLPTSDFANNSKEYSNLKDKNIIIYCRSGGRTGQVQSALLSQGITVSHLMGGIGSYFGNKESGSIS